MVVLTLGSAALIADFYKKNTALSSKSDFLQSSGLIKNFLQREQSINNPQTCMQTVGVSYGNLIYTAATGGKQNITITLGPAPTDVFQTGTEIPGNPGYTINQIYISDLEQIDKSASTTSFVGTVYIDATASIDETSTAEKMATRALSTIALQVDTATGAIMNCNMASTIGENQEVCSSIAGMVWNPITQLCDNSAFRDVSGEFDCPPGTVERGDGVCVPQQQNCRGDAIAKGFSLGHVECAQPPSVNNIVGLPNGGAQPVVPIGSTPAPEPSPPGGASLASPLLFQDITAPSMGSPPSNCVSQTSLGEFSYQACMQDYSAMNSSGIAMQGQFVCGLDPLLVYSANSQTCSAEVGINYSVPNLTASLPSVKPPDVPSCRCDRHMIANGEYCVFCVKDADLGWGYAEFTYGVSQCQNGNLGHVNNVTSTDVDFTPTTCSGGYKRGILSGGKYRQVTD